MNLSSMNLVKLFLKFIFFWFRSSLELSNSIHSLLTSKGQSVFRLLDINFSKPVWFGTALVLIYNTFFSLSVRDSWVYLSLCLAQIPWSLKSCNWTFPSKLSALFSVLFCHLVLFFVNPCIILNYNWYKPVSSSRLIFMDQRKVNDSCTYLQYISWNIVNSKICSEAFKLKFQNL